jgi:hypothetical protein
LSSLQEQINNIALNNAIHLDIKDEYYALKRAYCLSFVPYEKRVKKEEYLKIHRTRKRNGKLY